MKIEPAVRKETQRVAAGTLILTALMIAVFLILRKFDHTVLLGALLGCATAVGNFFLMALTVQHLTNGMPALPRRETPEEGEQDGEEAPEPPLSDEARQAGRRMQLSFLLRMLLIGGVAALAVSLPVFHPVASLLPLLFPNLIIALLKNQLARQKEV